MKFTGISSEMDNFSNRWDRKSWKNRVFPLQQWKKKYDTFGGSHMRVSFLETSFDIKMDGCIFENIPH